MKSLYKVLSLVLCVSAFSVHADISKDNYVWMSKKDFTKERKEATKRAKRKLASNNEITDDLMSDDLKMFRALLIGEKNESIRSSYQAHFKDKGIKTCSDFNGVKNADEVEACLTYLDDNYESFSKDLQFFAALLIPLRSFKSFTFKMYPLVSRESVTHSVMVTRVFNFAAFMNVNLPTDQWSAGFSYVAEPHHDKIERFNKSIDLQNYLRTRVYNDLLTAANRIQKLDFDQKIVWDNKLLYGVASFSDEFKRYRYIGEAERLATMASLHMGMSWISKFSAYNISGVMSLIKDISVLYGIDSQFWNRVDGITAEDLTKVINKKKYTKLFTKLSNGDDYLETAFLHQKEGIRLRVLAWEEFKNRSSDELDAFNSIIARAVEVRANRGVEKLAEIVDGKTEVRSDITGETVVVDLPGYYKHAPSDLKKMLPVKFANKENGESKMLVKMITAPDGKVYKTKYRNYHYGKATSWNASEFKKLFPEIKTGKQVADYTRVLNQSTGGVPVATIMNFVMLY